MATKFCMNCGGEFIASVEECPDCELPLVDERPAEVLEADDAKDGQVEYQLSEWAAESRVMLESLLAGAGIIHAWEGADLVVPAALETQVDALVQQVEVTTLPTLDPDAPKVAYDIDDWTDEQQTELMHALERSGVAYEFDEEGALVVLEDQEARVEAILDAIEFPDALPVDDDGSDAAEDDDEEQDEDDAEDDLEDVGDDGLDDGDDGDDEDEDDEDVDAGDGLEATEVMSDLFVAADRLMHSATDADGVLTLVTQARAAKSLSLPYGFSRSVWSDIVMQATALKDLLEGQDIDDDTIEDHARTLRDTLRQYV